MPGKVCVGAWGGAFRSADVREVSVRSAAVMITHSKFKYRKAALWLRGSLSICVKP